MFSVGTGFFTLNYKIQCPGDHYSGAHCGVDFWRGVKNKLWGVFKIRRQNILCMDSCSWLLLSWHQFTSNSLAYVFSLNTFRKDLEYQQRTAKWKWLLAKKVGVHFLLHKTDLWKGYDRKLFHSQINLLPRSVCVTGGSCVLDGIKDRVRLRELPWEERHVVTPVRLFQMGSIWVKVPGGFFLSMKVLEFKAVLKSWAVTMKDIPVFTLSLGNFTLV